jgi:hypothetical protein
MKMKLAVSMLFAAAAVAGAQGKAKPPTRIQQDSILRHWLSVVDANQQKYYMQHGTYTTDQPALGMNRKPFDIELSVVFAGGRSWWALASLGAARCAVWAGTRADFASPPTTGKTPAVKERQVVCDAP